MNERHVVRDDVVQLTSDTQALLSRLAPALFSAGTPRLPLAGAIEPQEFAEPDDDQRPRRDAGEPRPGPPVASRSLVRREIRRKAAGPARASTTATPSGGRASGCRWNAPNVPNTWTNARRKGAISHLGCRAKVSPFGIGPR
jgi:hypothetical protein